MAWLEFVAAFAAFFLTHAIPARPAVRGRLVATVGRTAFLIGYSLISLALLAWLIGAAGRAPFVPLWPYASWQRWAPNLALPVACVIAALAVGAPNPLSFGGARPEAFDPDRPGIAGLTRHPLLLALALWALAHLIPNGDLAHSLMFGLFGAFALAGMAIIDRRRRRILGEAEWRRLARRTGLWPLAARLRGDAPGPWPGAWRRRLLAGLLIYGLLFLAHPFVIGVWPGP